MLISLIISSILLIVSLIALVNLLKKVEKYEDISLKQVEHLQAISDAIRDSQKHLNDLDERGVFKSDDEVGYFFEQMQKVQEELNKYMLPLDYGKKKSKQ